MDHYSFAGSVAPAETSAGATDIHSAELDQPLVTEPRILLISGLSTFLMVTVIEFTSPFGNWSGGWFGVSRGLMVSFGGQWFGAEANV
ncbi:hypothetical protein [Amycolatopsis saalfeldensis]|uniref:hypothetical protein n=1 Tax=Amycolatopsis saalfeldensis TaxID=394193 RepID=UPI001160C277|nr:hypothetical protein [Amycolatopsis saalfeldensis]